MKKRSYQQNCSLAFTGDLIGERWTILLLRELLIQPCRFKQLNLWLNGMGTNLLTNRLKELEHLGIVEKQQPEKPRSPYQLTTAGFSVESMILAQIKWGFQWGKKNSKYLHYSHWDILAMKAFFKPQSDGFTTTAQFVSPSLTAWITVSDSEFTHGFGMSGSADFVIEFDIKEFRNKFQQGYYVNNSNVVQFVERFELPTQA